MASVQTQQAHEQHRVEAEREENTFVGTLVAVMKARVGSWFFIESATGIRRTFWMPVPVAQAKASSASALKQLVVVGWYPQLKRFGRSESAIRRATSIRKP